MKNSRKINFISFTDRNQIENYITQIVSINKQFAESEVSFYVGVDEYVFNTYKEFFIKNKIKVKIVEKFINKFWDDYSFDGEASNRITKFAMGRLVMFDIFKDIPKNETLIYLDNDIIIVNKFDDLYLESNKNFVFKMPFAKLGLTDFAIARTNKTLGENNARENIIKNDNYFNSGVLIINDQAVANNLFKSCLNVKDIDDETLLNIMNSDEFLVVDDSSMNFIIYIDKTNFDDCKIIHFAGPIKPNKLNGNEDDELINRYKASGVFDILKESEIYFK